MNKFKNNTLKNIIILSNLLKYSITIDNVDFKFIKFYF